MNYELILSEKEFYRKHSHLLSQASKEKYNKIFICIGYNELGWKYEDTFFEKYEDMINTIKELSPTTKIYLVSILHISKDAIVSNEFENNERIILYNSKIKNLSSKTNTIYMDLNSKFVDSDGFLISNQTTDGVHFTNEYYNKYLYEIYQFIITN